MYFPEKGRNLNTKDNREDVNEKKSTISKTNLEKTMMGSTDLYYKDRNIF